MVNLSPGGIRPVVFLVALDGSSQAEARVYLRSIEQRLREGDFASLHLSITSSVVASTDVVHTLTRFAESCTCREGVEELKGCHVIAIATHGRSGLQHLLAGSVTERVFDASRHPLLIVRSPQLQETGDANVNEKCE